MLGRVIAAWVIAVVWCQDAVAQQSSPWTPRGVGDCPGQDVDCSVGVVPDPNRCRPGGTARTAICFQNGSNRAFPPFPECQNRSDWCTYKSVRADQCQGGASPSARYQCAPAESTYSEPIYTKVRFSIRENGNFLGTVFTTLGTPEAAALVTAGCAAYGVDCSQEAAAGAAILKRFAPGDSKNGNEHRGIYLAPDGYEICRAKIDWGHTGIDGDSTFSAMILREQQNGLAYYAVVPTGGGRGHGIDSDLYLEFVPAGQTGQSGCFPTNAHVWNCKGPNCPNKDAMGVAYGIYPPARYP